MISRQGASIHAPWALWLVTACNHPHPSAPVAGPPEPLSVLAAGDLQLDSHGDPLGQAGALLQGSLRFANLETPVVERGSPHGLDAAGKPVGAPIRFAASPRAIEWLRGRFDVVALANNHALDQGEAGRRETAQRLASAGIAAAWEGHPALLVRRGRRVALVARSLPPGPDPAAQLALLEEVTHLRATVGVVLVSLHWGFDGSLLPSADQRRFAHRLIEAGAVAILGHGPHTMQGIERYRAGVIAYSMGNLAFACACTNQSDAYLLRFELEGAGRISEVRALPIQAGLAGAPVQRSRDRGLHELIATLSRDLGSLPVLLPDSVLLR